MRPDSNKIVGKINNFRYHIDNNLNCESSGIYRVSCPCASAYTGKTTTYFCRRLDEHFQAYKESSVLDHTKMCPLGRNKDKFTIQFLESSLNRGKYTLSEREYLWNERLGGELNVQKTLRNT